MKELSLVAKVDTMWANSTLPHHGAIRDKQEGSCPNSLDLAGPPHDAVSVRLHSAALLPLFQFTNAGFAGIAFWDIPTKLAYSLNLKKKKKKRTEPRDIIGFWCTYMCEKASLDSSWCPGITIFQCYYLGYMCEDSLIPKSLVVSTGWGGIKKKPNIQEKERSSENI